MLDQRLPVIIEPAHTLGDLLAAEIVKGMKHARNRQQPYVLGCPGGRTPRPLYRALAERIRAEALSIDHVVIAMMDEYVQRKEDGSFVSVDPRAHYSCRRFGEREILDLLNTATTKSPIPAEQLWLPDPAEPEQYDLKLLAAGGVDFFLLASGASDGHVAFNPPGTRQDSRTRVVELAQTTREDNLGTFPNFDSIDAVPHHGVSVGIQTIAALSHRVAMLIIGPHKRLAFQHLSRAQDYDVNWPASVIATCHRPGIYADPAAAS